MNNLEDSSSDDDEQSSSTPPMSNAMAFTIAFDSELNQSKNFNLKDSIQKFAPPKSNTIEKQRSPKLRSEFEEMSNSKNIKSLKSKSVKDVTGHISDSACYLIQRMLIESDLYKQSNNKSESNPSYHLSNSTKHNSSSTPVEQSQRSPSAGEKDSGVSDDKSESGTYTIYQNDPDVEAARKKIDQTFGISKIEVNLPSLSPSSSPIPSSFAVLKELWNPSENQNSNEKLTSGLKKYSSKLLKDSNLINHADCSNYKNNSSLKDYSSHLSFVSIPNYSSKNVNLLKVTTLSSKSDNEDKTKLSTWPSKQSSDKDPSKSISLKRINDLASLPARFTKFRESNTGQNSFNSFSEDINSYKSDAGSTISTEQNSGCSGRCKSESVEGSSSLRFNRAFALRRAKLGMDTLGVPLNLTESKQSQSLPKSSFQVTPKSNTDLNFNRNDGGRFSLRISKSVSSGKPPLSVRAKRNQHLSREDLNKELSKNRSYSASSDIEYLQRNKSPIDSNSKNFLHKSSSFSDNKNNELKSHKEITPYVVSKRVFSNKTQAMVNSYESNSKIVNSKPTKESMSHSDSKQNLEMINIKLSPMSEKKPSKKELSILDNIVISAIHSLSYKLKNNLQNIIETEKSKHPNGSEISLMIQELLPQVLTSEKKFEYLDVSINLSNTLKNLKKVEQSLDVISLLLEHRSVVRSASDKFNYKNNGMHCISNEYLDEY